MALERVFESKGYDTHLILRQEDFDALSQELIDLLVLDDDLCGVDCVRVLNHLPWLPPKPPTIVTYHQPPSEQLKQQLSLLGVDALINKCSHDQLLEIADYLLEKRPHNVYDYMT